MKRFAIACTSLGWMFFIPVVLCAAEWISDPSYYTHSAETGGRITQFAPIGPFFVHPRPDYVESGYRHERSSLRVGDSADNYVRTSQWGEPVRPYGEWQFPYRPYSTPYELWGPPYGFGALGPGPYRFHGAGGGRGGFGAGGGRGGFGVGDGPKLPYAQPFTDDTWYDRRTRPQGYRGSVDHVYSDKHHGHPSADKKHEGGEHEKDVDATHHDRPNPHTHYGPFGHYDSHGH